MPIFLFTRQKVQLWLQVQVFTWRRSYRGGGSGRHEKIFLMDCIAQAMSIFYRRQAVQVWLQVQIPPRDAQA